MDVKTEISEETHRVLSEEFEEYDPEEAQEFAEEWVEQAPPPEPPEDGQPSEREADGGIYDPTDEFSDG